MASTKPDKAWFQDQLARRGMSQRELAARMGLAPSMISYIFNGERQVGLAELKSLTEILQVNAEELIRRLGFSVGRSTHVPIRGYVNDDCTVAPAPEPLTQVDAPPGVSRDGYALQLRSPSVGVSIWDGLLCYVSSGLQTKPAEGVGQMVVAHTVDGAGYCGLLSRGYAPGTYNIMHPRSGHVCENLDIQGVTTAHWFRAIR